MAEEAATEAAPAAGAAAAKASTPLFSPAGLVVAFIVMIIEGGLVFMIATTFASGETGATVPEAPIQGNEATVPLGVFRREVPGAVPGRGRFQIDVTLVVNPALQNAAATADMFKTNRNEHLRDTVTAFIWDLPATHLREWNSLDTTVRSRLLEVVNREFSPEDAVEPVPIFSQVYFKDPVLPN